MFLYEGMCLYWMLHVSCSLPYIKPATGRTLRPGVSAFPINWNVWTPAYSRPCYLRQDARVEHALLEKLTLFPNANIVIDDVDTHRSNHRLKTQTDNVNDGNEISLVSGIVGWQH